MTSEQVPLLGGGYVYLREGRHDRVQLVAVGAPGPITSEVRMSLSRDEAARIGEQLIERAANRAE